MSRSFVFAWLLLAAFPAGAEMQITRFAHDGHLTLTNDFTNGVCSLKQAGIVTSPFVPVWQVFPSQNEIGNWVAPSGCFRACAVAISPDAPGFTNLIRSYSTLSTVAGSGVNKWSSSFKGGPATNALLTRPDIAMAHRTGNIYLADKGAHGVRQVRPDGTIVTVAGVNSLGNGPDAAIE